MTRTSFPFRSWRWGLTRARAPVESREFELIWLDFWKLRAKVNGLDPSPCGNPMCCPDWDARQRLRAEW